MRITRSQLRHLINEEFNSVLSEQDDTVEAGTFSWPQSLEERIPRCGGTCVNHALSIILDRMAQDDPMRPAVEGLKDRNKSEWSSTGGGVPQEILEILKKWGEAGVLDMGLVDEAVARGFHATH